MNGRADQPGERVCERALVWHLGGLRIHDHAALAAAASEARMVFPLVVNDPRDPITTLPGYGAAVRSLARDYAALGAPLLYLEGDGAERVVDAARDARADYVYVLERSDTEGRVLLEEGCQALALWGFRCRVFASGAAPAPASLSGALLPGDPLPPGPLWNNFGSPESRKGEAVRLGLCAERGLPAAEARPILGAGGLVFNARGEVLLLRHQEGSWVFPKGHVDPGESELQAALREVAEEAGVRARCSEPETQLTTHYLNKRREPREIRWFLCLSDEEPTLPETLFPEGGFFPPADALALLSFAEDRKLLRDALALRDAR